jgi:2-polyprenyl-3-methyl-5-hydroxy-6-metoxy-1,4-benzoquinol methylase
MRKYSDLTVNSNSWIKRFSHNRRFQFCIDILKEIKFKNLLDFGAGDGHLIYELSKIYRKKFYYVYEPNKKLFLEAKQKLKQIKNVKFIKKNTIKKNYYDVICINEVFEHLNSLEIEKVINVIKNSIKKKKFVIISVPIEVGVSSIIKNLVRYLINQRHRNLTLINFIKSIFFIKIRRSNRKYDNSHIGFNYKNFIIILKSYNMNIIKIKYSPFNYLKSFCNSQVYFLIKF